MKSKYFNKQLIAIGAGTLGGMFAGATLNSIVGGMNNFLSRYSVATTGTVLVIAGSMLMSSANSSAKKAGYGVGGVGISLLANEGYQTLAGGRLAGTPALNGGSSSSGSEQNAPSFDDIVTV